MYLFFSNKAKFRISNLPDNTKTVTVLIKSYHLIKIQGWLYWSSSAFVLATPPFIVAQPTLSNASELGFPKIHSWVGCIYMKFIRGRFPRIVTLNFLFSSTKTRIVYIRLAMVFVLFQSRHLLRKLNGNKSCLQEMLKRWNRVWTF